MTGLSVLDLSPIAQGSDAAQSFRNSLSLARHAERLGFRREAITLALGKLTAMGCLVTRRGVIEVLHRECLEALVCDCYWIGQEKVKPDPMPELPVHTMPCCC